MKVQYIELLGERHPLCFSMTAAKEITEDFGSFEEMANQIMSDNVSIRRDAATRAITVLLRAGRAYARARGDELPKEITCPVADIIGPETVPLVTLILTVIQGDSKREVATEDKGKNGEATPRK